MSEPTRLAVKVTAGENSRPVRAVRDITLERIITWIQRMELDEYTTKELIALASKYPNAALPSFRKNFNLMLNRVRAKRKKEQIGDQNAQSEKQIVFKPQEKVSIDEAFKKAFEPVVQEETKPIEQEPIRLEDLAQEEAEPTDDWQNEELDQQVAD